MNNLIKLVRTYRFTAGLAERIRLAEEIFKLIAPGLHLFVYSNIPDPAAQGVFQEVLKAVAADLKTFHGDTEKEFWKWCHRIARNTLNDHCQSKPAERMLPAPPEDPQQMMDAPVQPVPISPALRHDLEYAMRLLTHAKPECFGLLWDHFVIGLDYADIAEDRNMSSDDVRLKIERCLVEAKSQLLS